MLNLQDKCPDIAHLVQLKIPAWLVCLPFLSAFYNPAKPHWLYYQSFGKHRLNRHNHLLINAAAPFFNTQCLLLEAMGVMGYLHGDVLQYLLF